MWNLRNKIDEHMGGWGKDKKGSKPQETLNGRQQTEGWWRVVIGRWARWMMGIREITCCDEHWVLYESDN